MCKLQIASARAPIGHRDNARATDRRRLHCKPERRESHACILARPLDGCPGGGVQRSESLEFPLGIGREEYDAARVDDERYVTATGPRLFNVIEADLHRGDADHLIMIANGLRIVESGLP